MLEDDRVRKKIMETCKTMLNNDGVKKMIMGTVTCVDKLGLRKIMMEG